MSALMPSKRSPDIVERAIRSFQAQTYGPKELVILRTDVDEECPLDIAGEWFGDQRYIRCIHVPPGLSIGELRNVAARVARGSILAAFDDDDVSAPDRLARSVAAIDAGACVVGTSLARFEDPAAKRAWLWDGEQQAKGEAARLLGGSLVYRREIWEAHPFDDLATGEDSTWLRYVIPRGESGFVHDLRDPALYTATISPDNTCVKHPCEPTWKEIPY